MTKIEDLLQIASTDPRAPAWNDLYQEVCHQGHCYPDGFFLVPLLPVQPSDMDRLGLRLHTMSIDAGRRSMTEALTYVFGHATYTQCSAVFHIADRVCQY